MKIYLIRHGQTTGDIEDRYGGSYDDHLTDTGCEQIGITAKKLVGLGIQAIYCSPLIRAKETASIIIRVVSAPIEYVDGLKERHYGVLSGLTKDEAKQRFPEAVETHKDPKNTDPEGESYQAFYDRVIKAFDTIVAKGHKVAAIITHGGSIKCIYRHLGKGELGMLDDGHILKLEISGTKQADDV